MQRLLMQVVVPKRFHAQARSAHPGLMHADQAGFDEAAQIGATTQGSQGQRALPDDDAEQRPLPARQAMEWMNKHMPRIGGHPHAL